MRWKHNFFFLESEVEIEDEAVRTKDKNVETESEANWTEDGTVEDWMDDDLREFEAVGKRLVIEALCWHKDAAKSIRAVYTGTSRTTNWREKKEKKSLENDAKGMKTLDTYFGSTEASTSMSISKSSQPPQVL